MKSIQRVILITLAVMMTIASQAQHQVSISKVVIDAGHGGKDPGAVNKTLHEKDINLAVALKLGALINKHYPDVKVTYTRSTDVFIPLDKRGDIANKAGADLFISIHTNAAKSSAASGTETYVMGVDKGGSNLSVAMRENDVVVYESDYTTKYQGYEPGSAESFIIFSLMQYSYLDQSLQFASLVQKQYTQIVKLPNRGVKQAGFLVLWRTAMPSVLTELGYIGNEKDSVMLASDKGRDGYARSLFNAFSAYKTLVEGKGKIITLSDVEESKKPDEVKTDTAKAEPAKQDDVKPTTNNDYYFSVQVGASSTRTSTTGGDFAKLGGKVFELKEGNMYRYYTGECATYDEALKLQAEVRKTIKDAFVVALCGGKKITITDKMKRGK